MLIIQNQFKIDLVRYTSMINIVRCITIVEIIHKITDFFLDKPTVVITLSAHTHIVFMFRCVSRVAKISTVKLLAFIFCMLVYSPKSAIINFKGYIPFTNVGRSNIYVHVTCIFEKKI